MKQKLLFALAAIVLLLGFFLASRLHTDARQEETRQHTALNQANLLRMHSPTLGPAEASVVIVEFFDPACETCRDFYPFVKELMAVYFGQIRLALRYSPFHEGAGQVVRLLEAARRQNRYWETLETLYASQQNWVQHHSVQLDQVWAALQGTGLDLERARRDMEDPAIAAIIQQDMADARALRVERTPEFFVNGQPMPSFGRQQLRALVQEALRTGGN